MSDASGLLKEPWSVLGRQREASRVGIWIFLGSEILFFGALFLGYSFYRAEHPADVLQAARETDIWFGTINTGVLLTSSYTMAMASQVGDLEERNRRLILGCLMATVALGCLFMLLKGLEYKEDLDHHLWPGPHFRLHAPAASIFFAFYWIMTGVHAVHLSIGIALVLRLILLGWRSDTLLSGNPQLGVTALYWHLVDLIWIFLYPIFYLPGRSL